jgi:flavorubredoxin
MTMQSLKVLDDLYMFSTYFEPVDLTFNQYLLLTEEPVLVHTVNRTMAAALVPALNQVLGERPLRHVLLSHFEAGECGGLPLVQAAFPGLTPLCSAVTARQLTGFGLTDRAVVKRPGEQFSLPGSSLEFIGYPSEMHLWEGLLAVEPKRGILFGSDLFLRRGPLPATAMESDWPTEVEGITAEQVPDPSARKELQVTLAGLAPVMIAPGHGPWPRLRR